jgi:anti-sigma B factor antagonist
VSQEEVVGALEELTEVFQSERTLGGALASIAETATLSVPGCDAATIAISIAGRPATAAITARVSLELDMVQYDTQDGPCLTTFAGLSTVRLDLTARSPTRGRDPTTPRRSSRSHAGSSNSTRAPGRADAKSDRSARSRRQRARRDRCRNSPKRTYNGPASLNPKRPPIGRTHCLEAPMSSCEIDVVAATNGVLRLEVDGEIDTSSAPGLLDSVLCAALASDHRQVVIDLRHVTFIDSTGLGAIIETNRQLRGQGAHLVIVRPSGLVRRLFEITGLDSILDLRPDWADGHTAVSGS